MRLQSVPLAVGILLLSGVTAHAATIFTFSVQGTTDFDTSSIQSFSASLPTSFSFVKDIDATSPNFASAVATGSTFAHADFIAYDGSIAPPNELFRYTFGNLFFSSFSTGGGGQIPVETISLNAESITASVGPAAVPEPASILLLGSGLLCAGVRRWRQRSSR